MSLLKRHLEDRKAELEKELAEVDPSRKFFNQRFDDLTSELEEIGEVIAALEPAPQAEQTGEEFNAIFDRAMDRIAANRPPVPEQTGEGVEIPEGWTAWNGVSLDVSGRPEDLDPATTVEVLFDTGATDWGTADDFWWDPIKAKREQITYRIIAYRVTDLVAISKEVDGNDDGFRIIEPTKTDLQGDTVEEMKAAFDDVFAAQKQGGHDDTDAGLEPGNLTQPEIDAATAELFEAAGERDGLDADPAFAPKAPEPVTNPEADALARAHDYYSPEKVAERNKFDPFRMFKREDA